MNKTYTLQDGGKITATCASDFLTQLRKSSRFDHGKTDINYMISFAFRYKCLTGRTIRTANPEQFVEDLIQIAYIKTVE